MAIIPSGQKFHTVSEDVNTQEKGSAQANSNRDVFTMQDISDTAAASGGGGVVTSLTTTGASGASTLIGGILNVPVIPVVPFTSLTTTGASGDAATLVGGVLDIPTPIITSPPLVWSAPVYQAGTGVPIAQFPAITTLTTDLLNGGVRFISFYRTNVGQYLIRLSYSNNNTSVNKLSLTFGDAVCRMTQKINGGNFLEFAFESRTPAGVLSDDLLLGNNGANITLTYYA